MRRAHVPQCRTQQQRRQHTRRSGGDRRGVEGMVATWVVRGADPGGVDRRRSAHTSSECTRIRACISTASAAHSSQRTQCTPAYTGVPPPLAVGLTIHDMAAGVVDRGQLGTAALTALYRGSGRCAGVPATTSPRAVQRNRFISLLQHPPTTRPDNLSHACCVVG